MEAEAPASYDDDYYEPIPTELKFIHAPRDVVDLTVNDNTSSAFRDIDLQQQPHQHQYQHEHEHEQRQRSEASGCHPVIEILESTMGNKDHVINLLQSPESNASLEGRRDNSPASKPKMSMIDLTSDSDVDVPMIVSSSGPGKSCHGTTDQKRKNKSGDNSKCCNGDSRNAAVEKEELLESSIAELKTFSDGRLSGVIDEKEKLSAIIACQTKDMATLTLSSLEEECDAMSPRPESPEDSRKRNASLPNDEDNDNENAKKPAAAAATSPEPLVISDAEGLLFAGTVLEGTRFNGRGCFTHLHTEGDHKGKCIVYEGGFLEGKFHGYGKSQDFALGCTCEGMFENGEAHGRGKCRWESGWEYEGEFRYDKRHGKGTCRQLEPGGEVYSGEWKDDKWDGIGCLKYAGGRQYDGDFRRGELHGYGKYQFADGSGYEGCFNEGLREGHGFMTYADNSQSYDGEWRSNMRDGEGTLYYVDGSVFNGRFREDEKHGIGKLHLPDGKTVKEQ